LLQNVCGLNQRTDVDGHLAASSSFSLPGRNIFRRRGGAESEREHETNKTQFSTVPRV
jgi:hypothetical protein